ncbi:MAG: DNA mismatch repair endonuclease MutL [Myxococcota bacterium]
MGRIRRLSEELINQIAAGEVVERPASVVKELAENAIDAGATQVKVALAEGGLAAITVVDDGHGMSRADALLSLERHATSKLSDLEGLSHILTKGFRGEALPSIASVSRFTLLTSEPDAPVGTRVTLEGGSAPIVEEAAPIGGTRFDVVDLFFNTPARRKFLKRESTELSHCEEAVTRLALAHPEVAFSLEHGGKLLISAPATPDAPAERIAALLGAEVAPHLLAVEERRLGISVTGYVASPEFTLPTARGLYTFVNRRYVRDRGINAAVQRAYQDSLPPGRQPVAVLMIELDPRAVDVNVHPQKLEVRFADPRGVQEALGAAISRALKAAPWRNNPGAPLDAPVHAHYALAVERFLARAQSTPGLPLEPEPAPLAREGGFGTARPGLNEAPPPGYFSRLKFLAELGKRFWLCEGPGGTLVILDPRAVSLRVHLTALTQRLASGALAASPPGLFSATLALPRDVCAQVLDAASRLARLGVEVEDFGGDTVAVRRVPAEVEGADLPLLLGQLARVVPGAEAPPSAWHEALVVLARAAPPPASVSHDQVRGWLDRLDRADFSLPAPGARVVVRELPLLELEGG